MATTQYGFTLPVSVTLERTHGITEVLHTCLDNALQKESFLPSVVSHYVAPNLLIVLWFIVQIYGAHFHS